MRKIQYSTKRNQNQVKKSQFGKFNHENDVIPDAHKVICKINLNKFGDIGTGSILAKNREIV
jgi:hypothetical protein